ncbi:ArsR/SmtB family transcription factor [Pseudomonas oligotrophica]|uniref:ArsR/SmtB family transcription factor n=1 Tax=Pseudomonas oligotrophica TaxID=2912055 RepID=UPI001F021B85|nr:metalloregulator ArsR/SmtB family transcription factor [Pseudomonas oligotrophica]MCF7202688.1 metalloregulator ArsR/SmtB family transcription factor [Pseudomonas oligotrophica]
MPAPQDDAIKALAHPLRREILGWLREPERFFAEQEYPLELGVCAGQIGKRAGLSQSTVSAHLARLQRAGLVSSRKVGQWHFFRRNDEAIRALVEQLQQTL